MPMALDAGIDSPLVPASSPANPDSPETEGGVGETMMMEDEAEGASALPPGKGGRAVRAPFKNPHYVSKHRRARNLKQIVAGIKAQQWRAEDATYVSIAAPPTMLPPIKLCDVSGLLAPYTDPKTGLRFHSAAQYAAIRAMGPDDVAQRLALRGVREGEG